MQTTKELNIPMLKDACDKSSKIRRLFELYSDRGRGRQSCTVPRVRRIMKEAGTDLTREEAIEIMKTWQQAGCGRYVSGRRDQDNRFLWSWDIPSLAKRVTATPAPGVEQSPVTAAPRPRQKLPDVPGDIVPMVAESAELTPLIPMSIPTQGIKIRFAGFEIELPPNLSTQERAEAEMFIRNLRNL